MDDGQSIPSVPEQLRVILVEPVLQSEKSAMKKMGGYLKMICENIGDNILEGYPII
jgi:hypothetical protein